MSWVADGSPAWEEPLAFARRFAGGDIAFLYSSLQERFSGSVSYLFAEPVEERGGSQWSDLPVIEEETTIPVWVGYLGYGMREQDARGSASPVTLPDFRLVRYARLWRFDHGAQRIDAYSASLPANAVSPLPLRERVRVRGGDDKALTGNAPSSHPSPARGEGVPTISSSRHRDVHAIQSLHSNLTRAEYEAIVAATLEAIRAGDFYQANITRKFFGRFAATPDSWALFTRLCAASPAPFSAYIRHGGTAILSSSPESFLTIAADGSMTTRPIKGSARRSDEAREDDTTRAQLLASPKNHAENLMIVDLMRNDLARVSEPRSVAVVEQSALYSYRTIHHLISTIRARKSPAVSAYEAVRACFPAGSMTGAPKIAAMHWCTAQEKLERGIYSGAIGWFGGQDTCDLSVVIRTLVLDGDRFEFQVGGGIVADSTPAEEWRETITKARGILTALGLRETDLEAL